MPAYVIVQGDVHDPEQYELYKQAAAGTVVAAGGKDVVRGGATEVLEGDLPASRTVVLEFPTMQTAIDWYGSDEYQAARKLRENAAQLNIYLIDGA
ncbi:MAG: DUF1330 domain-containing protein [Acidimicrobiia bacterium]|nr:DUF1330 domain-containing protein [Acidimicrobiia bacterium]